MCEAVGVPEQRAEVQHWTLKLWSPMDTADGKGLASTTTKLSRVVPRRNGGLLEGRISGRGRREVRVRPIKESGIRRPWNQLYLTGQKAGVRGSIKWGLAALWD